MEIQTFMLCKELFKGDTRNVLNATTISGHNFFPKNGEFPFKFELPFYALLRRQNRDGDEEITLRFNVIDADAKPCGKPSDISADGIFPNGHLFMSLNGKIAFEFNKQGDYRLDITADEEKIPSVYSYNIEVVMPR